MTGWIAEHPGRAPSDDATPAPRRRRRRIGAAAIAGAALCAFAFPASQAPSPHVRMAAVDYMDVRPGNGSPAASSTASAPPNLLSGGGAIQSQPKIYLVFWGKQWSSDPSGEAALLQSSLGKLAGAPDTWSTIMDQYCQGGVRGSANCTPAAGTPGVTFVGHDATNPVAGVWFDNATNAPGSPSQSNLATEAITAAAHFHNTVPAANAAAQYVIATAHGASSPGFGSQYCAWHSAVYTSYGTLPFTNLPYITDAGWGCGAGFVNSGSAGATDGVTIVEGHEFAETVTDPLPGAGWVDSAGEEIGDKCAWVRPGATGGAFDLQIGGTNIAMQGLWSNAANGCADAMVVNAPTLTGVSPSTVAAAGGTQLTLSGTNLSGGSVTVAGAVVAPVTATPVAIVVNLPAHAAGAVPVVVSTPGGTLTTTVTYSAPAPTITAMTPASGPVAGWHQVTVTGTNLWPSSVAVGTSPLTPVSATPTQLVLNVPSHNPGTVQLVVTTPAGSASSTLTYLPAPTITAITPARGPSAGGTQVTITGANLAGATVTVGGIAPTIVSSNATSLVMRMPPRTDGTAAIVVTTIGGVANTSYLYADAPTATALSVNRGPAVGGTVVTLTGTFLSGATVTVGGRAARVVAVDAQGRSVTFATPAQGSSTTGAVVVTTPYGTTTGLNWTWTVH